MEMSPNISHTEPRMMYSGSVGSTLKPRSTITIRYAPEIAEMRTPNLTMARRGLSEYARMMSIARLNNFRSEYPELPPCRFACTTGTTAVRKPTHRTMTEKYRMWSEIDKIASITRRW